MDTHKRYITKWEWTQIKWDAVQALAHDELTDQEIAQRLNINRISLWNWKQRPEFAAALNEARAALGEAAQRYAIGKRMRRMAGYDDRRQRLLAVIEARAADPTMANVPGGQTGLVVRQHKGVGQGHAARVVEEYAVDTALLKELRELEKQAAIEAGQWVEKQQHAVTVDERRTELDRALDAIRQRTTACGN